MPIRIASKIIAGSLWAAYKMIGSVGKRSRMVFANSWPLLLPNFSVMRSNEGVVSWRALSRPSGLFAAATSYPPARKALSSNSSVDDCSMASKIKKAEINGQSLKMISKKQADNLNKVRKEFILDKLDCGNCAAKIEAGVNKIEGVSSANINFMTKTLTMEIEEISKVRDVIAATAEIIKKYEPDVVMKEKNPVSGNKVAISLVGLCCANCAGKIERQSNGIDGVKEAVVDFTSQRLLIDKNIDGDVNYIVDEVTKIVKRVEPDVKVQYLDDSMIKNIVKEKINEEDNKKELIRLGVGAAIFALASAFKFSFTIELILYFKSDRSHVVL